MLVVGREVPKRFLPKLGCNMLVVGMGFPNIKHFPRPSPAIPSSALLSPVRNRSSCVSRASRMIEEKSHQTQHLDLLRDVHIMVIHLVVGRMSARITETILLR